jgi:hypothetical protein
MALGAAPGQAQGPRPDPAPRFRGPSPDAAPFAPAPRPSSPPAPAQAVQPASSPAPSAQPRTPAVARTPASLGTRRSPHLTRTVRRRSRRHTAARHRSKPDAPDHAAARSRPYLQRPSAPEAVGGGEASPLKDETPGAHGAAARLMLQLGMLFFLLYLVFVGVWFRARTRLRAKLHGVEPGPKVTVRRLRGWCRARVAEFRRHVRVRRPTARDTFPASPHRGIVRRHVSPKSQPTALPRDLGGPLLIRAHLVEDAKHLQWPIRAYSVSVGQYDAASRAVATVDWEPVESHGPCDYARAGGHADPGAARTARERAPRGANRDAVLRAVAVRRGVTMRELEAATGVKRSSLPKLVRTLTLRGELEKIMRPDGQTGYLLVGRQTQGSEAPLDHVGAGEGSE